MIPIYGRKNAGSDLDILYTVPQTNIDPAKGREGRPVLYSRNCLFSSVRRVFINGMFTLKMTDLQMISHDLIKQGDGTSPIYS